MSDLSAAPFTRSLFTRSITLRVQRNSRVSRQVDKLRAKAAERQAELRRLYDVLRAHVGECRDCGLQCPLASYRLKDPELLKDVGL